LIEKSRPGSLAEKGRKIMRGILRLILLGGLTLVAPRVFAADSVEDFYKGKQLILQTGSSPGDGYDLYGRLVARFISKYIPGHPAIVDQYVPSGGSLLLANQFANTTPRDGSVFGLFNSGVATTPLLDPSAAKFDPRKFKFIGSPNLDAHVFMVWYQGPVKSFDDLFNKQVIVGATAPGSPPYEFPLVTNALLGTKLKLVPGYKGSGEVMLAVERGEIDGYPGLAWVSAKNGYGAEIAQKKWIVLAQYGLKKHPDLQDVPQFPLGKTEADRQLFEVLYSSEQYGRPFAFPPDVPDYLVAALRQALESTVKDPEFIAAAKTAKADLGFVSGEDLQAETERLYQTPPDVIARLQQILGTGDSAKK